MKNNFDKIVLTLIICLFGWYILNRIDKTNEDKYIIEKKAYKICGKDIYITDFTYNDVLNISELLSEIEIICKSKNNY